MNKRALSKDYYGYPSDDYWIEGLSQLNEPVTLENSFWCKWNEVVSL